MEAREGAVFNGSEAFDKVGSIVSSALGARGKPLLVRRVLGEWSQETLGAAVMTVMLVAAGVILAAVIMNRFSDVLSLV